MSREFIIGRSSASAIKIPDTKTAVSGSHVKIRINDNGEWEIEDLNSANGAYLRDENGDFQRIYKKKIHEDSILRLGGEGHNSHIFMAHKVLYPEEGFSYEFRRLKKQLARQQEEETDLEKKNERNLNILKASSLAAFVLSIIAQYAIPGLRDHPDANLWISRTLIMVAPFFIGLFFKVDTKGAKILKQKRQKTLTCPGCNYPLPEFDIKNMQCSRCKAK